MPQEQEVLFCTKCGARANKGTRFCTKCGKELKRSAGFFSENIEADTVNKVNTYSFESKQASAANPPADNAASAGAAVPFADSTAYKESGKINPPPVSLPAENADKQYQTTQSAYKAPEQIQAEMQNTEAAKCYKKAAEYEPYVRYNKKIYSRRFFNMLQSGKKTSWNTGAFLLAGIWYAYRRMYGLGFAFICIDMLIITIGGALLPPPILALLWIFFRVIIAIFANNFYMKKLDNIAYNTLSYSDEATQAAIKRKAGVSILWPIIIGIAGYCTSAAVMLILSPLLMLFRR